MTQFRVGMIGCGRPWKSEGATGFGMANYHARGYAASPDTQIVALADLSLENAQAFQAVHGGATIFGVRMERQGISHVGFRNGVEGLMLTRSDGAFAATNRLIGSDGMIEVTLGSEKALRAWSKGRSGWQAVEVDLGSGSDLLEPIEQGVLDLIDALKSGREPELSGERALRATELIFATYESSRRRGRVDLPLDIDDSPLIAMLGQG